MSARHKILFAAALVILLVILCRMAYLAGPAGQRFRDAANKAAREEGILSAIRGRIFSADGKLLAWSVRRYDLVWKQIKHPILPEREQELRRALKEILSADITIVPPQPGAVIKYDLTINELEAADKLAQEYKELDVHLRWERCFDKPSGELGEVRQEKGQEIGISGYEAQYDAQLRGTPGVYSVMLDRRGRWIDSTFRIKQQPQNGQDVYLEKQINVE